MRRCSGSPLRVKTYERDGALWLRTTDYGDDKDRVMRKSGRRLHLLRARRRLPHHQVGARLREGDQRAGHGPSQHGDARARRPAGGGHGHSRRLPRLRAAQDGDGDEGRRGGEDLQARRHLRHPARPDRRGRAATRCASSSSRGKRRHGVRVRRRPGANRSRRRTRSTTSSTRTRACAACSSSGARRT